MTAVANPDQTTTFGRITNALTGARNRVSNAILGKMLPDTMVEVSAEIGCIVEYDGETVMASGGPSRMGIEVQSGDLIFVNSDGVWLGLSHFEDMPVEIETYNFITSGTRNDYTALIEAKLSSDLKRQRDVVAFLMAA